MTTRQAQHLRTALRRGGFTKTDTGMTRGVVFTKWELPGVASALVQTTYSLTTGRTDPNNYTVRVWAVEAHLTKRQADTLRVTLSRGGFHLTDAGCRAGLDFVCLDLPGVVKVILQGTATAYTIHVWEVQR